jgi:hypothetical protein
VQDRIIVSGMYQKSRHRGAAPMNDSATLALEWDFASPRDEAPADEEIWRKGRHDWRKSRSLKSCWRMRRARRAPISVAGTECLGGSAPVRKAKVSGMTVCRAKRRKTLNDWNARPRKLMAWQLYNASDPTRTDVQNSSTPLGCGNFVPRSSRMARSSMKRILARPDAGQNSTRRARLPPILLASISMPSDRR